MCHQSKSFTLAELRPFNGVASASNPEAKIFLGVRGIVFDMVFFRRWCGTLKRVACYFEEGGVVL